MAEEKRLTVAQVVAKLQMCDQTLFVSMEGCDCDGDVGAVNEVPGKYVYLNRVD